MWVDKLRGADAGNIDNQEANFAPAVVGVSNIASELGPGDTGGKLELEGTGGDHELEAISRRVG